ncbi:hypothetical protein [Pseudoalteromonas rhizosphaerae]|uniref:hypothetical protein n=1 Tax=Pseudoalteromonas rhizosphaerae TaxID=2518973 RepID=UPI00123098CD|nr:hypothetical protein [Pseudoalteromonas rhizosphaerae]
MIKIALNVTISLYFLVWLFIFSTGGGTYSDSNKESIEQSIRYYHSIRDDLNLMVNYVNEFKADKALFPSESELIGWVEANQQIENYVKNFHIEFFLGDYPSHVVDELGFPDENSYVISLWTGDQHLYYASWLELNSADVSVEEFGIARSNSGIHVLFSLLLLLVLNLYIRKTEKSMPYKRINSDSL